MSDDDKKGIKVHFRGPMLFVSKSEPFDQVNEILIPDSTSLRKHADGTEARPHDPGLLLIDGKKTQVYVPLAGRSVSISAKGGKGAPTVDGEFLKVPSLNEMTNSAEATKRCARIRFPTAREGAPTTIEITGGRMSGENEIKKDRVELLRHNADPKPWDIVLMPTWLGGAPQGTITLTGGGRNDEEIELTPGVEVYLYNWDVAFPTRDQLRATRTDADEITDLDFKFVYTLLTPENQTWQEWLDGAEQGLPSPRIKHDSKVGFTPATCNSSRIGGVTR